MKSKIEPYLKDIPIWQNLVKDRYVILDTDSVIAILEYGANIQLMEEFISINVDLSTINLVGIELMNTNSEAKRTQRLSFMELLKVQDLPIYNDKSVQENVGILQSYLQNEQKYPSPTDLLLAATLVRYNQNAYLLTGNTTDFPLPLFKRVAFLILQNKFTYKILTFLQVDMLIFNEAKRKFQNN